MKKLCWITFLLIMLGVTAYAEDGYIQGEGYYNSVVGDIVSGELELSPGEIINKILDGLWKEVDGLGGFIKTVMLTGIFGGILSVVSESMGGSEAGEAGFYACFSLMSVTALEVFFQVVGYATEIIGGLCDFITKLEPVFMGLLVTAGAIAQGAVFKPVITASVYIMSLAIDKCVLPLAYFSAMLAIVNNLSGRIELGTLNKMLQSVSRWILVGILTIFSAILTFYGFASGAANAVTVKGIKFAVGSLVPVVGNLLSDTVETVISGAGLLKTAVGTAGMITVITITAMPVIKIWVLMMLLKLCASLIEPFSHKRVTNMLLSMSDAVTVIFSMVITTAVLFLISIGIILGATGVNL